MLASFRSDRVMAMFSALPPIDKRTNKKETRELTDEEFEEVWQADLKRIRNSGSLTANQLLERAAASRRKNKKGFDDYFIPDFEDRSRLQNWSNAKIRALAANNATSLRKDDRYADELMKGFKKFDLNPANPYSWRILLEFFVLAHFEKYTKNVGRREWTTQSYCKLLTDYFVMCTEHPGRPATFICDRLVKTAAYKHLTVSEKRGIGKGANLRRAFYNAKNERKNWVLKYLTEFHLKQLQQNNAKDKALAVDRLRKAAKNRAIRDIVIGDYNDHPAVMAELGLPEF